MNILIVTPHFYPENFRINDFAIEFIKKGHQISVITGIPDYPSGNFFDGYGFIKKNRERYEGIDIYRAPIIPRGSGSNFRLAINYLSYVIGASFMSLFLLRKKLDIIFVYETSPITVGLPAILIKKIKHIPICFWVLDLWPESVMSAGNIKSNIIPAALNPIVKFIYDNCDKILVSSNGFINSIVEKGVDVDKIEYFPQWAESLFKPMQKKDILIHSIPEKSFKIIFAGNIGEAQDFPSILNAAKLLKGKKHIHWLILGNGRRAKWVKNKVTEYGLQDCFHMLGSHPINKMPEFYAIADAMLFSLKENYIFSITIPAKVQSYLACGKPVLAMVNGEAAKIINENKAGFTCNAGDYESLAKNVVALSQLELSDIERISTNALHCYRTNFDRDMLFERAEKIFFSMIAEIK